MLKEALQIRLHCDSRGKNLSGYSNGETLSEAGHVPQTKPD